MSPAELGLLVSEHNRHHSSDNNKRDKAAQSGKGKAAELSPFMTG